MHIYILNARAYAEIKFQGLLFDVVCTYIYSSSKFSSKCYELVKSKLGPTMLIIPFKLLCASLYDFPFLLERRSAK